MVREREQKLISNRNLTKSFKARQGYCLNSWRPGVFLASALMRLLAWGSNSLYSEIFLWFLIHLSYISDLAFKGVISFDVEEEAARFFAPLFNLSRFFLSCAYKVVCRGRNTITRSERIQDTLEVLKVRWMRKSYCISLQKRVFHWRPLLLHPFG